MSLFCPPAGLSSHLVLIWPLIWAQILMARAWVRATYGKGTLYQMRVAPWGQVFITSIEWVPGQDKPAPTLAALVVKAHACIAALTDGSMAEPAYAAREPLSLGRGGGVRGDGRSSSSARAEKAWPLIPNPFSPGRRGLPLPET